ncbi:hypothetical protein K461DRAFT_290522 [Myriangium duriaei CBS 260.36]|uniref:Uncharacterized protein n=1 Tax=Myriangium duriaei CBS 260.36 TaxID=1168546 RepID=A0A9P4JAW6_9PEZI|nr:hypothetical protein K461DRAFT_290522 [Myriangium duriaei CBS 260.36]
MKLQAGLVFIISALLSSGLALPIGSKDSSASHPFAVLKRGASESSSPRIETYDGGEPTNKGYIATKEHKGSISHNELWKAGQNFHDGLRGKDSAKGKAKTKSEHLLVSAVHSPGHGIVMASKPKTTKPHNKAFAEHIKDDAQKHAKPLSNVLDLRAKNHKHEFEKKKEEGKNPKKMQPLSQIHTEDLTYLAGKKKFGPGFPAKGSTGVVYGSLGYGKTGPVNNCGGTGRAKIDPSCHATQKKLGINYLDKSTFPKKLGKTPEGKFKVPKKGVKVAAPKPQKPVVKSAPPKKPKPPTKVGSPASAAKARHEAKKAGDKSVLSARPVDDKHRISKPDPRKQTTSKVPGKPDSRTAANPASKATVKAPVKADVKPATNPAAKATPLKQNSGGSAGKKHGRYRK